MLTFEKVYKSFISKYPEGQLTKLNNNIYTVLFKDYQDSRLNKEYNYKANNLLDLARKLKLDSLVNEYKDNKAYTTKQAELINRIKECERKIEEVKNGKSFDPFADIFGIDTNKEIEMLEREIESYKVLLVS